MPEFLKDINLVYIIGIISGAVAAVWAFYKFIYEKKLERFKEASTNLFSNDEDTVLAAVANLGVFKKDFLFERNTIDVLLTRLYKELNYNITNAIIYALIQFSNRRELLYIANEILGINRNFFFQTQPYKDRLSDINRQYDRIHKIKNGQESAVDKLRDIEKEQDVITKQQERLSSEFIKLNEGVAYELLWHKQITGDTFARIIRRAGALKIATSVTFINYLKQIFFTWDFRFYGQKIPLTIYQNTFAYIHLVQFSTTTCSIKRSGLERAIIADIQFNNIHDIYDCSFEEGNILDCSFNKGAIRQSIFTEVRFSNVIFKEIYFEDIFFINCSFTNCNFINCTGLSLPHFYSAVIDDKTVLPAGISAKQVAELNIMDVINTIDKSNDKKSDKDFMKDVLLRVVKDVKSIHALFNASKDNPGTTGYISKAAHNFTLAKSYNNIIALDCSDEDKWQIIFYLFNDMQLPDLITDIYDAGLADQTIKNMLPYLKPGTQLSDYRKAVDESLLLPAEKKLMTEKLDSIFGAEV